MPEKRDIRLFLLDVSESIERIDDYISEMTYEDFLEDRKTIDAVVRNFEVIGEASKNIPDYFKDNYPDVNWKAMTRMRDKLIHGYFGVSPSIVWETAKNDLPPLKPEIKKILEAINP